ncbi:hypothetical protein MRX96_013824 [Rhipicephalus microplus]
MLLDIKKHSSAAQLFLSMELVKEAVEALIAGGEWSKAKKVAQEFDPGLEEHVDQEYKRYLRSHGQTDQLANVDIIAALDLYAEKKQWKKCLEMAEQQGQQNFNIYRHITASVFALPSLYGAHAYRTWSELRDVLYDLVKNLESSHQDVSDFEKLLLISSYYATRSACQGQETLAEHAMKISVSLLRYIEHIPPDKAFYEAGLACKACRFIGSCDFRASLF